MTTHNNQLRLASIKTKEAEKIFLATHYNPDGDGIASICAFIEFLESLNKDYFAYCYNEPPQRYSFLPHFEKINYQKQNSGHLPNNNLAEKALSSFKKSDLIIIFDCGSLSRTKLEEVIKNRGKDQFLIEFDHHPKIDDYADLEIRRPAMAATTEVIYGFFKINQIRMNKNIATCILTGLLTDTANFLYPSTSEKTVEIAAEMMSLGARLPKITENALKNQSLASMKIWGKVMERLQINKKYNIAIAILTLDDINSHGVNEEELDGISNFLGNLYGVKAIILLKEDREGKIRGSLRTSHPEIDVSLLAKQLGGGGHVKSSGFTIFGKLQKTKNSWQIV